MRLKRLSLLLPIFLYVALPAKADQDVSVRELHLDGVRTPMNISSLWVAD
jgi:hypothetical protein